MREGSEQDSLFDIWRKSSIWIFLSHHVPLTIDPSGANSLENRVMLCYLVIKSCRLRNCLSNRTLSPCPPCQCLSQPFVIHFPDQCSSFLTTVRPCSLSYPPIHLSHCCQTCPLKRQIGPRWTPCRNISRYCLQQFHSKCVVCPPLLRIHEDRTTKGRVSVIRDGLEFSTAGPSPGSLRNIGPQGQV